MMTQDELLGLIRQYEMASLGSEVAAGATITTTTYPSNAALTTLQLDRYNALNGYLGRPLGNEIENRSQVVLPVLRDTVNWIMPQLMRMFVATRTVCRFDPESEADTQQAEQETLAVNHVFMAQNNGVVILHDYFWDALMMRNGYVEVYTKEEKAVNEERYTGLVEAQLAELTQDTDEQTVEVVGKKEYQVNGPMGPIPVFDIHIKKTGKTKKICVTCLPPEEFRVSPRAREGLEDIPYSSHITLISRSDLITEGYDREVVQTLQPGKPNWMDIDALARSTVVDQLSVENPSDHAMQEIELRKVILKVDYDGDGIAELRRVIVGGDKILENELIEETPFVSGAPMRMPHRHTGMSMYDLVMDLQILQTNLWRQGLDNLAQANNTRVAVDWRRVNFDDLLTSRPGGPIRGDGPPQTWIQPIEMPSNLVEQVIPALEYIDQMRSSRTGVGKGMMGLDPDELQDVTKGAHLASLSQAALILELIARMLAEGVKGIFLKIHGELLRNPDKPLEFEISAGKWAQVDPSSWKRRTKVTPNVGLGSGNREEMRTNVQMLAAAQTAAAQVGIVGPQQVYESAKVMCEALGFTNPERFFMDPKSPEFAQHMQMMQQAQSAAAAPQLQVAKIKAQTTMAQEQAENQRTVLKLEGDLTKAREQHIGDQMQMLKQRELDAHNASRDRMVGLEQQHQDLINNLIKIFGTIEASKAKAGMDITGQMVGADIDQAAGAIEHNQTLVQNEQTHGHTLQQQSQQSQAALQQQSEGHQQTLEQQKEKAKTEKKGKKRKGKLTLPSGQVANFEMTDE